ncbi:MAG: uroporphyrinogen decarboxylase family protein [Acetomicrobium sp.]|jgi:uroporphyrinogen decarboxylase|uniref:uroporphyrinogen decarboxylase family protein n=1 Tax=Acetomicrobium sp. TaxID=1872099 RepID=UPI003BE51ED5
MNKIVEYINALGRTPVIPLLGFPGLKFGGNTIRQGLTDAEIQYRAIEELANHFEVDALIHLMDLTVEAEALGAEIHFPEDASPSVKVHPLKSVEQLKDLSVPDPEKDGRMPIFIETVRRMKENLSIPVGAYVIGPYTLAGEMMKVENTLKATIKDPDPLKEILAFMAEVIKVYAMALVRAGADILTILEPTASMLSPKQFDEFSGAYIKEIYDSLPECMTVLHICGNTTYILKAMAATGAEGLSLDTPVKLHEVIDMIPDVVLIGNVDPVRVMLQGSPEKVYENTLDLRRKMKGHKNFILSTGCDLPPETPFENIEAFVKAGRANL